MDKINRWKLADQLSVYQISLLIAGYDPAEFENDYWDKWEDEVKRDISPFLNAIKNAARKNTIEAHLITIDSGYAAEEIDWVVSTVNIDSFCEWMRTRNYQDGFFVGAAEEIDKIGDLKSEYYAPKLAAAVRAWNEVTVDPNALIGKTPKKALEIWLRKHANEYGLTGKDGNPNELGIEEISKIANWKPAGGATPTPSPKPPIPDSSRPGTPTGWVRKARPVYNPNPRTPRRNLPTPPPEIPSRGLDDDIPF